MSEHGDMKKDAVTLKTIAEALGVSRTTVSNAYSKPNQLTPELRAKILAKAEELCYCGPDPAARTLRSGKSGAYGLLLNESLSYLASDPAAVLLLQGIAGVFDEHDAGLLILPSPSDRSTGVDPVRNAVVDGFLLYSLADDDPRLPTLVNRNVPTVVIEEPALPGAALLALDDRASARTIAEHVIALGHRRLAVLTFPLAEDNWSGFVDAERMASATIRVTRDRIGGLRDAAEAHGIDWSGVPIFEVVINTVEEGMRGGNALLEAGDRPTAILVVSDQLAIGVSLAARARGLQIPRDLSVSGFDDIPEAARSDPPLTTVRQPLREKGERAARLLLEGWVGPAPQIPLETELVIRASTGPPPH